MIRVGVNDSVGGHDRHQACDGWDIIDGRLHVMDGSKVVMVYQPDAWRWVKDVSATEDKT